jgi:hypothetical protein
MADGIGWWRADALAGGYAEEAPSEAKWQPEPVNCPSSPMSYLPGCWRLGGSGALIATCPRDRLHGPPEQPEPQRELPIRSLNAA